MIDKNQSDALRHTEYNSDPVVMEMLDTIEALWKVAEYAEHSKDCIRSFWEAGAPTPDGGYRTKFKGKWYQSRPVDEEPKCDCGLDALRQEK